MDPNDRRTDTGWTEASSPSSVTPGTTAASGTGEAVKQDLDAVKAEAQRDLEAIRDKAAEDVRHLRHEAGAQVEKATEKAKSFAGDQKDLAAGQLEGVASALDKVASELQGGEQAAIGRYAQDLARGAQNLSQQIRDNDVDDLMGMAQDFGRKQPVAFLGAAALLGFAASRFALASAQRRSDSRTATAASSYSSTPTSTWQDDDALTPSEDRFQSDETGRADNVYGR